MSKEVENCRQSVGLKIKEAHAKMSDVVRAAYENDLVYVDGDDESETPQATSLAVTWAKGLHDNEANWTAFFARGCLIQATRLLEHISVLHDVLLQELMQRNATKSKEAETV